MNSLSLLRPGPAGRRGRGLLFGGTWLVFLSWPVSDAFARHEGWLARALVIALVAAFCCVYLVFLTSAPSTTPTPVRGVLLGVLCLLAGGFCVAAGESGMYTFVYLSAAGMTLFSGRRAAVWAGLLVAVSVALPLVVPGWVVDAAGTMSIVLGAIASAGFVQLLRRNWELRRAQEEIARLAVTEERLRFSRDLHDILGHSLTVITVKAELAGRLVDRAPDRAVAEIRDVERLAREALADVRATVAGYRGTNLTAELSRAARSLEAAGIAATLPNSVDEVTGSRRELFGWVVREGVTNVVRHSRARRCQVVLTATSVEILDDGVGADASGAGTGGSGAVVEPAGHGLAGLRERVQAAGGTLSAGPRPGGGFRLAAHVPATRDDEQPSRSPVERSSPADGAVAGVELP